MYWNLENLLRNNTCNLSWISPV